jgi:hypothetical protein
MTDFEKIVAKEYTQAETDAILDKAGEATADDLDNEADAYSFGVWFQGAWIKGDTDADA